MLRKPYGVLMKINHLVLTVTLLFFYLSILHLIGKSENPTLPVDCRSLACCTVLYEIISKMLCKRLKEVLSSLIDWSQSAFVPDRSVLDNVLLWQDLYDYDRKGIIPRCLAKIDIRKAYDVVHWGFY